MTAPQAVLVGSSHFTRRQHWLDPFITEVDVALQVLAGQPAAARPNPAGTAKPGVADDLTAPEKKHAAGLMRVNHVGEVCAQALYRGQAAASQDASAAALFYSAAADETDHLAWCQQRLRELDSRPSLLNPLWYVGSFTLGVLAARAGVARNLGFMAETERQVEAHLEDHLHRLPAGDMRSRKIVEQMKLDEIGHRVTAERAGAVGMPAPVKGVMRLMSKLMTSAAYRL
ncbi:MAG: 2-polyprenyl-3-methyl-6-methoxy-1,4-benzoquinone monooxygenase [Alcaligenaceae bacterium]